VLRQVGAYKNMLPGSYMLDTFGRNQRQIISHYPMAHDLGPRSADETTRGTGRVSVANIERPVEDRDNVISLWAGID